MLSKDSDKPKPNNMVWKPKTKQMSSQPVSVQRSSTKEQEDKCVKLVAKAAPKKGISSCPRQDLILTNRFKCLEDLT